MKTNIVLKKFMTARSHDFTIKPQLELIKYFHDFCASKHA